MESFIIIARKNVTNNNLILNLVASCYIIGLVTEFRLLQNRLNMFFFNNLRNGYTIISSDFNMLMGNKLSVFYQYNFMLYSKGKWRSIENSLGWYALEKKKHHSTCVLTTSLIQR
jgi:hypothetical protein